MCIGCLGSLDFPSTRVHACQTYRGQGHRNGQFFTKQLNAGIELAHVLQDTLAQGDIGQIVHIAAQRVLGVGTAVNVVEQESGIKVFIFGNKISDYGKSNLRGEAGLEQGIL